MVDISYVDPYKKWLPPYHFKIIHFTIKNHTKIPTGARKLI